MNWSGNILKLCSKKPAKVFRWLSCLLIINLAAVSSVDDTDNQLAMINGIKDTITADSETENVFAALKLFDVASVG